MINYRLALLSFIIFLGLALIFNFIPIKYAKTYDKDTEKGYYICYQDKKIKFPDKVWVTILEDVYFIDLCGNEPSSILSKNLMDNRFIIEGSLTKQENNRASLMSNGWDIIYPIQRNGLRSSISSAKYLTVYDFNWLQVIKMIFCN